VLFWGPVSAHGETFRVTIDKLVYAPAQVTAKVGDTIEWVNQDILAHTATAVTKNWDVMIGPKQTARLVLNKAGSFDYFCRFHPNMKGRVVVAP
jgi:plastocyanin